jgi:hypothetical protein
MLWAKNLLQVIISSSVLVDLIFMRLGGYLNLAEQAGVNLMMATCSTLVPASIQNTLFIEYPGI